MTKKKVEVVETRPKHRVKRDVSKAPWRVWAAVFSAIGAVANPPWRNQQQ